jgi:hypothetical protein
LIKRLMIVIYWASVLLAVFGAAIQLKPDVVDGWGLMFVCWAWSLIGLIIVYIGTGSFIRPPR